MKILVADDDRIARKVLRALLEEAGFEVDTVEDGRHALATLLSPQAPHIAIIDWVMPGMSGPEVCAKLRTARLKIRPYVLMLSSKTDKNDIVAGLDAGADDYLSKPFNLGELLARLRVANRVIDYEVEVQEHVEELEDLTRRHQLLGELITKPIDLATPEANAETGVNGTAEELATAANAASTTVVEALPITLESAEIDKLAIRALRELGLDAAVWAGEVGAEPFRRVTYSAWSGFMLQPSQLWMDLLFEAEPGAVNAIFERVLKRPPSISASQSLMVEALGIIASAFRATLKTKGVETQVPYLAQIQRIDRTYQRPPAPSDATVHVFDLDGSTVTLTAALQLRPVQLKPTRQLQTLDVLAECYPPSGVAEVPLLNQGTVLNERYIEKLRAFGENTADAHPVPVIPPTPLAAFFNHGARH